MKKLLVSIVVLSLMVSLVASPAYAQGENAKGAVKVDLVEWNSGPEWIVVGSAILNTTASGKLIVVVNVDTEPNLEDYDVIVFARYAPPPYPPPPAPPPPIDASGVFPDVLDTNARGQGNAQVKVDIGPPQTESSIWVSVTVRQQPTDPWTPPEYHIMPLPVEVPLK